jgi:long-subunit acyl-CoA synthetase (AMP-forming)/cytochrome P450
LNAFVQGDSVIQETLTAPPPAAAPAASPLPGPRGGLKLGPGADRLIAYEEAARVHGGVVCVSEEPPLFLVSHPDHVKHVLQDNQANYRQNVRRKVLMGRQSLALSAGDEWRQRRRLLQPLFNQQRLAPLAPGIVAGTQRLVDRWRGPAGRGEAVDVAGDVAALTLDLLIEALLGGTADRGGLRRSVSTAFEYFNNRARAVRQRPLWVPTPNNLGLILALRRLSAAVRATVARRRESGEPGDLLSAMLTARDDQSGQAMSPEQIQDEIMMLLVMGHMTTAVAATWTFFLLARHPEAEERMRAEIGVVVGDRPAGFADVQRLVYTRKVIEETMRLYPPSWTFSRMTVADDEIGGCRIPAGAVLTIAPWVTHRRPDLWPDPERFDPERFDPQRAAARPRFAYYPFGGGPRVCIARDMAMMELPLIFATVLQRYTLRPVPGASAAPVAGIVLRPRSGLRMTLHDPAAPPPRREVARRPFSTLPELLLAPPAGDAPACQHKVDGRYVAVPRADLLNRARRLARGLAALGVAPGERLALLAANGPEWVAADLGALAAGAVVVPLQADLDTGEAVRLLRESGARYVLADAGRLADLLGRRGELPDVRAWIQLGGASPVDDGVLGLSALLERGEEAQAPSLETLVRQRRPEEPASLIYTPGTTGAPKAVELTHGNLAAAVLGLAETVAVGPGDVVFSYLPLTRPAERSLLYLCLHRGATLAWAGSEATAGADARLVQPHVLSTTPDFWKHLLNWLFQTVQASSPRRRRAFQLAVSMGRAALPFRIQHRRPSLILGGGFWLGVADRLVFSRVRERLGGRFRFALSGVDGIPHGWITFLWAAGIPVYETYSLAEAAGIVALNTPRAIQPGTVGIPLPGVEIRIAEDGEILVRGEVVARGGQPSPQVDAEGWLHTGDSGAIDEAAMLNIQGRQGDLFIRPGSRRVSPGALETLVRSSHFVSHVFVTGEGRPHNVALVAPDVGALPRMIQRFNIADTGVAAVMRDPRVREHFDQDIQGFNDKLPAHEKIQAWHLLSNEFSVAGGELTAAGTLRRQAIREKYAAELDRLYAGQTEVMKGVAP